MSNTSDNYIPNQQSSDGYFKYPSIELSLGLSKKEFLREIGNSELYSEKYLDLYYYQYTKMSSFLPKSDYFTFYVNVDGDHLVFVGLNFDSERYSYLE